MDKGRQIELPVGPEETGRRFDLVLQKALGDVSRAFCQKLIRQGHATVNGEKSKPSRALVAGDRVRVDVPPPQTTDLRPEEIPLDVLFEDKDLLVIDKPAGLVVHPAAGHQERTLVHALLHHCRGELSGIGGVARPGIVHRLDKDTSGCLLVAKNDVTHRALIAQFQGRDVRKEYLAFVWGELEEEPGKIAAPIGRNPRNRQKMAVNVRGAKPALTEYEAIERFEECTAVKVVLHTGRTHQIRVHFASIGHPVLGDATYGRKRQSPLTARTRRQMLHAHRIGFEHPRTKRWIELTAPLPADMKELLNWLRGANYVGKRAAMHRSTARMSSSVNPLRG